MSQNVTVYGVFLCTGTALGITCNRPLHRFVSSIGVNTLKCQNPDCDQYNVSYQPPIIALTPV